MAKPCINPQCDERSRYFGAGALYALEKRKKGRSPHHTEYFWLCASCAAHFTVQMDAAGNVTVIPQSKTSAAIGPKAFNNLRLVFRSKGITLPVDSLLKHGAQPGGISARMIGRNGQTAGAESFAHCGTVHTRESLPLQAAALFASNYLWRKYAEAR